MPNSFDLPTLDFTFVVETLWFSEEGAFRVNPDDDAAGTGLSHSTSKPCYGSSRSSSYNEHVNLSVALIQDLDSSVHVVGSRVSWVAVLDIQISGKQVSIG